MKLPDFLSFEPFNNLRREMKAELLETNEFKQDIQKLTLVELETMQSEGLDIDINKVAVLEDGTLAYKDRRILIYIRDSKSYYSLPKFHFSNCLMYKKMKNNGRGDRYVASIRIDGYFDVIRINNYSTVSQICHLDVCKYCLGEINYNNFSKNRDEVFKNFSLAEYFLQYPADFLNRPKHTNLTAPINQYSIDFREVSIKMRQKHQHTCQKCYVVIKNLKYLHVHHINGLKHDNSENNLLVLCFKCHANEPYHAHMKNGEYHDFVSNIYPSLQKNGTRY